MSIKGLSSIIAQREQQFGNMSEEKTSSEDIEYLKKAVDTLANNQKLIYEKLEEVLSKFDDN